MCCLRCIKATLRKWWEGEFYLFFFIIVFNPSACEWVFFTAGWLTLLSFTVKRQEIARLVWLILEDTGGGCQCFVPVPFLTFFTLAQNAKWQKTVLSFCLSVWPNAIEKLKDVWTCSFTVCFLHRKENSYRLTCWRKSTQLPQSKFTRLILGFNTSSPSTHSVLTPFVFLFSRKQKQSEDEGKEAFLINL